MGASPLERDRGVLPVLRRASMRRIGSTYHRPRLHPRLLLATLAALATLALGAPGAGASTLLIEGAGDGHGVGMSQDGALGYAEHGFPYTAILAHYYTDTTIGQAPAHAVVKVLEGNQVARVPLERYVRGVVAAEMPSSWPIAALEAQAVASRTYALTDHAGGASFDVYSDTRSQVYSGVAAETAATNAAVAATAGQIVLYGGHPAITYFFASSGGMTENIENSFLGTTPEPWLKAVADPYETHASAWRRSLGFSSAAASLRGLVKGTFRGIEVLKRGVSPRIVLAEVLGSGGATRVSGPELAARLGLDSTWAYFSVKNGATVKAEPDRSGQAPLMTPAASPPPTAPAPSTPATGPGGGAQAPGATQASLAGGAVAG